MKINKFAAGACLAVAAGVSMNAFAATNAVETITITGGQFKLGEPFAPGEVCNGSEGSNFGGCVNAAVGTQNSYVAGDTGGARADALTQQPNNALNFNFNGTVPSRRVNAEFFATASGEGVAAAKDWANGFQGEVDYGDANHMEVGHEVSLNLGGWYATWNGTNFLQGTDSTTNGGVTSAAATGTITSVINNNTGTFDISWFSLIEGGPFDGLTGYWIMQGVLTTPPVPEPETYGMMLAGLGLVGFMAARRRKTLA